MLPHAPCAGLFIEILFSLRQTGKHVFRKPCNHRFFLLFQYSRSFCCWIMKYQLNELAFVAKDNLWMAAICLCGDCLDQTVCTYGQIWLSLSVSGQCRKWPYWVYYTETERHHMANREAYLLAIGHGQCILKQWIQTSSVNRTHISFNTSSMYHTFLTKFMIHKPSHIEKKYELQWRVENNRNHRISNSVYLI